MEHIENEIYLQMLGMKINFLRKQKNMTQTELADLIGTTKMQLIRIEKGKVNSTIGMLRNIAKVLEIAIEELILVE